MTKKEIHQIQQLSLNCWELLDEILNERFKAEIESDKELGNKNWSKEKIVEAISIARDYYFKG